MNKEKRPVSAGTLITLCLTVAVTVGCIFMFSKMSVEHDDVRLNAQRMIGLLENALAGPTPEPENKVRTVTVNPPVISAAVQDQQGLIKQPVGTEQPVKEYIPEYTFTATFGGVLGFHSDISQSAFDQSSQSFQYHSVLAPLADYLTSDFNSAVLPHVVNSNSLAFSDVLIPASALDAIRMAGFDELLLNSEHTLDQGQEGAMDTITAVLARGFSCGGVNMGTISQGRLMQLNSARIALFTYTEGLTESGEKNRVKQDGYQIINLFDLDKAKSDIANAKAQGANCIMVFIHWGKETDESITPQQRKTAQALAQMGADVIIGSHPEKVLPVEMIETIGTDGQVRNTLVAYSMGTLLSESREGNAIAGMLLHVQITCNANGYVRFDNVEYTPTYIWKQMAENKNVYRVIGSSQAPPLEMDQNQKVIMERALRRIQDTLEDCPVKIREW